MLVVAVCNWPPLLGNQLASAPNYTQPLPAPDTDRGWAVVRHVCVGVGEAAGLWQLTPKRVDCRATRKLPEGRRPPPDSRDRAWPRSRRHQKAASARRGAAVPLTPDSHTFAPRIDASKQRDTAIVSIFERNRMQSAVQAAYLDGMTQRLELAGKSFKTMPLLQLY